MRRPYVSRNQHPRVSHLFLHLQWRLYVRPAAAVPVFPGGVAWPFGLFLCHSLLLALDFHPPGWGLVFDSGTMACLELLW
jgi:hypothetical protein